MKSLTPIVNKITTKTFQIVLISYTQNLTQSFG